MLRSWLERLGVADLGLSLDSKLLDFRPGSASNADWASPAAIKAAFGNASILRNNRVVFNIGGNKHRLVLRLNYPY